MDERKATIASNLIRLRLAAGMTQAELGEKLNYSDKSISKWERGDVTTDVFVLMQIAEIFGVDVDYVVKGGDRFGIYFVEKGASTRTLYLPKGCTWYDMSDNLRAYEGGQTITVPVGPGSIPMFLRGSAIFVTSEDVKKILRDTWKQMDYLIAAEKDCTFVQYDDDGHSEDYKNGVFAKTTISVKAGDQTKISFHREGSYEDTVERITLKLVSKKKGAFWATVDGVPITRYIVRDAWEEAESGWYYNLSDRTIWLKTPKPRKNDFDIVISTEKFDLIGMAED